MKWEINKLPSQSSIYWAYLQDRNPIHSLYHFHPHDEGSVERRIRFVDERWEGADRKRLVEVLARFHEPELLSPVVERNLERLREPGSLVVIGGQQAGLLTGPLYTIHKAVTVIQLAKWAEAKWNRPVVPVFWIAGEDHDWDEVDHIWVFDKNRAPVKYRFSGKQEPAKKPVSEITLDAGRFQEWVHELAHFLPDSAYKKEWFRFLQEAADSPMPWTRFFARIMHRLFAECGLIFIDSHDPRLRELEVPFFRTLIRKDREITAAISEAEQELQKLGFHPPAELKPNQSILFFQPEGERQLLYRQGEQWITRDGRAAGTEELLGWVEQTPNRFSNNVFSRPLMQEYLFPTLFFVGGPGEVGYWSLLKRAFETVGMAMPMVVPRWQATIRDRTSQKRMAEWGIRLEADWPHLEAKRDAWLKQQEPLDVERLFQGLRDKWCEEHEALVSFLDSEIGRNIREMGMKNKRKIIEQIDYYERFIKRTLEEKHRVALRHWDEMIHTVKPQGKPQERVWNLIAVWNAFGIDWIKEWLQREVPENGFSGPHFQIIL